MTAIENQKTYWRQQLAGLPPPPQLPLSSERPPVSSFVRETVEALVEPEIWLWAKELALKSEATPQAALISALYALFLRYAGQTDLALGTVVEKATEPGQGELVALRASVDGTDTARELIRRVAARLKEASEEADVAFEMAVEAASHNGGISSSVFNTIVDFSDSGRNGLQSRIAEAVAARRADEFALAALVVRATQNGDSLSLVYDYDSELLEANAVKRLAGHLRMLLSSMAAEPDAPLAQLALLDEAELEQLLVKWNDTTTEFASNVRVHELFEAQVGRTPEAVAAVWRDKQLTYRELNERANQLAAYLSKLNVGPNTLVGICVERSLDMLVGLLGILKAGAGYLPLDPTYPAERIAFMLQDARASVLLTQERLAQSLPTGTEKVVRLDTDWPAISAEDDQNLNRQGCSENLAYVIYTSGSTGKPKGVMVEHRNVVNFFAGMDQRISHQPGSTWLAVTSLSFDISVLELFWTLTRGFKVVLFRGEEGIATKQANRSAARPVDFSLFYFSSDQTKGAGGAYRLLIEGAKFADEHGFTAVWTPERHFHDFGGLYPNPSVTSAAVAMVTKSVQIRSGSVVAPLHSPIRIAEEWAVVDNLSNGRAAISFASGWMPEDFAIKPENYASRKDIMFQDIEIVRKLWRGESVQMPGPLGKDIAVRVLPRPVQRELPFWITAAGNPETFEMAGKLGANLLTHLLGQSIGEVAEKVAVYRKAWQQAGHRGRGRVALMLHTFVGESVETVKATVRQPLIEYLRKSADLIKGYAWSFSAFKRQPDRANSIDFSSLPKEEMDALLAHAFERYFETSGLFGTPETCLTLIDKLRVGDIDEVACLIDFGINPDTVLENLKQLELVQKAANQALSAEQFKQSIPELIEQHEVTHLQCTPSMANMLLVDERSKVAFSRLRTLLVGGEALPATLAEQLRDIVTGDFINMYGPTETTIWSSTYSISQTANRVTVGRPIANTQIYILDHNLRPVPVGLPGELMIGGAGVARGYLNRPELTAERFIPNPFSNNGLNRIYRTGDLARYLPDGNIELLGRIDQQVKIRGHRIELGEIEATLSQHPMVREAVVVAKAGPSGDTRLVAYVVPREAQKPGASQLRSYIKDKLPEYMVPAHVVLMTAFPQTPNKKIDRKALPAPDASELNGELEIEAPASEIEEALSDLYAELLQVTRVGRNDDFFELGGDSLSAVQLLSRIRQTCNVELPLESLFDSPTVAGLAGSLEALFIAKAAEQGAIPTPNAPAKNGNSEHSDQPTPIGPEVFEPPRTPTEERLAKVWAEALGLEKVGRADNFFALGGNSLIAVQLTTRLESVFHVRLPLETLFNAPTVQQMAAFLASDSTQVTTNGDVTAVPTAPTSVAAMEASGSIPRRKDLNQYSLSSGQQRLWFLQQLEGGIHYNDHFNLRLTGGVNVSAVEQSIGEILRRHEAMRASFTDIDGQPVQRIRPDQNFTLPIIDLRSLPPESRLSEATRLAVEEARKPFDLAAGPLWRFQLVILADEDHILVVTAHHIAIDGWSRGVFLSEFGALYKAFLLGRPSPLSELPIQYTDYAAWQSDWLNSDEFTRQLHYWKQRLAGTPPLLELPADRPRPPIESFRGARHYFTLSKSLTTELRNLGRQEKVTFFMTLLAGFQSLLYRYTGQEDIVIGTPVANRPQTEIQGLIGYFLNTVVLRGDCTGTPTFRQLLKRVRTTSLEAFRNQDLPVEKLIDALQLERNQSHSPLFQVFFVLQNVPTPDVAIPGLSIRPFEIDNGTAKFDLSVSLFESEDGLTGWLEYATDLFDAERMERLSEHYRTLLEAAVANPDLPMSQLSLLTPGERRLMLEEWNQTEVEYRASKCVHEIVEEQAALFPDRIAVEFDGREMTYSELDRRTTLLASHLQSLGVGPDSLVCLCLERSLDLVVGVLGVLKAGGAYVPLDPGYPAERLAFILADSRAKVLLTESALLPILSGLELRENAVEKPSVVCLDQLLADEPTATRPLERKVGPGNLAYVIYTSGSTGKPKGVQVEHRSVVNFLDSMRRKPGLTAKDVLLAVTTLCFDIAGLELLLPLTTGARVLIASRDVTVDGLQLARLLEQSGVTVMQATPATWRLLIEAGWKGHANFKILCGGEAWTQELAEALLGRCGSLWNMYGPTETTIWSAACEVTHGQPVLIGPPIANTEFYVLDKSLQAVPVGVSGELHIGGHGVARGYANRPELTAERFISDPFASGPGARLYKTGDSVRYRTDGRIEYLGRMDHQVKVRGFRIELGEIESVLAGHATVREAVVVVREDGPAGKRLVAYLTAKDSQSVDVSELRNLVRGKLPDYMVPSAFVALEKLPLTPNGKVDRKALPSDGGLKVEEERNWAPPEDEAEQSIARVWGEVLGLESVGRESNFFDLGGHSLLLITARRRLEEIFCREVPVVEMFRHTTVRSLAKYLTGKEAEAAGSAAPQPQLTIDKDLKQRRREVRKRLRK
jgi:natural product biosynthesis luciferase-like monooxygenase protein/amino acid adenylation domain-containing protein